MKIRLYHYWRSSSSWRVRWALELKKIQYESATINLLSDESDSPSHIKRNPMGFVPVVEILDSDAPTQPFLGESMAIIEWLEELFPNPTVLPGNSFHRAKTRQLAEMINAGVQPLGNLNVIEYYSESPDERKKWSQHWIRRGLAAYQTVAEEFAGRFSIGDQVTLADLYLIPQIYNGIRSGVEPGEFPLLEKIYNNARATEACKRAEPESFQPK